MNRERNALSGAGIEHRVLRLEALESRLLLSATLVDPIADLVANENASNLVVDLSGNFTDQDANTTVRFVTVKGNIDVVLYGGYTPYTVQNFMNYVNSNAYDNSFIHRSVRNFIIQGGGFTYPFYQALNTDPPIPLEAGILNTRGTIAMARTSAPNSATSQWYFNVANNTSLNPTGANTGYAVFGKIIAGLSVVDSINNLPIWNASSIDSALSELPLINFDNTHMPDATNLVMISDVQTIITPPQSTLKTLTLSVSGNSNTDLVTAKFTDTFQLELDFAANKNGTAVISVLATDLAGNTHTDSFTVTVNAVNQAPVANGQTAILATLHGAIMTKDIILGSSDIETPEADRIYAITQQPAHGTLSLHDHNVATYTYTGDPAGVLQDTFKFTVTDNGDPAGTPGNVMTSAPGTVTVNIFNDNSFPVATAQNVSVDGNSSLQIILTGTDVETPNVLTFAIASSSAHGTLTFVSNTANTATYSYKPTRNYSGPDSFTFTATDGGFSGGDNLTSDPAAVNITVNPSSTVLIVGDQSGADAKSLTYWDADKTAVTITPKSMNATLFFSDSFAYSAAPKIVLGSATGATHEILSIEVHAGPIPGTLTIGTRGGADNAVNIMDIEGHGVVLAALSAKGLNLTGDAGVAIDMGTGYIAGLTVHNITGDVLMLQGAAAGSGPAKGFAFAINNLYNANSDVLLGDGSVKSIKAASWQGGTLRAGAISSICAGLWNGNIEAAWIKSLTTKAIPAAGLNGNFTGNIALTGADPKGVALGTLTVAGDASVGDSLSTTAGGIGSITAGDWSGNIDVPWIKSITMKPNAKTGLTGDFTGAVRLSGRMDSTKQIALGTLAASSVTNASIVARGGNISTVNVKNAITNSDFISYQDIGKLTATTFVNSNAIAGWYDAGADTGFLNGNIGSVAIKGVFDKASGAWTAGFEGSAIAANMVGKVSLGYVNTDNGANAHDVFGVFVANSSDGKLSKISVAATQNGKLVPTWTWDSAGDADQQLPNANPGDFHVKLYADFRTDLADIVSQITA